MAMEEETRASLFFGLVVNLLPVRPEMPSLLSGTVSHAIIVIIGLKGAVNFCHVTDRMV